MSISFYSFILMCKVQSRLMYLLFFLGWGFFVCWWPWLFDGRGFHQLRIHGRSLDRPVFLTTKWSQAWIWLWLSTIVLVVKLLYKLLSETKGSSPTNISLLRGISAAITATSNCCFWNIFWEINLLFHVKNVLLCANSLQLPVISSISWVRKSRKLSRPTRSWWSTLEGRSSSDAGTQRDEQTTNCSLYSACEAKGV